MESRLWTEIGIVSHVTKMSAITMLDAVSFVLKEHAKRGDQQKDSFGKENFQK